MSGKIFVERFLEEKMQGSGPRKQLGLKRLLYGSHGGPPLSNHHVYIVMELLLCHKHIAQLGSAFDIVIGP